MNLSKKIFENITNMKQTQNKNLKEVPMDLNDAIKENKIRINPEIISRVTDERKELCYRNININNIFFD